MAAADSVDSSGWSATQYNKIASFVYSPAFTAPILELLAAKPGEHIIDFGCGSGEVTMRIAEVVGPGGLIVGVDYSESMITKAKLNGLNHAFVSDIQDLQFPAWALEMKFNAVFSNACLHWCKSDPKGVLESAKRVLKPGGRIVAEMGGFLNSIGVRSALRHVLKTRGYDSAALDPWYYPSVEEYRDLLVSASFEPTHLSLTPRLTPIPAGLYAWLETFVRSSFLSVFDEMEAEEIMREVVQMCEVDCKDGKGDWSIVYTRLRFCAILK